MSVRHTALFSKHMPSGGDTRTTSGPKGLGGIRQGLHQRVQAHVPTDPICLEGKWFAMCACRQWVSEGQYTRDAALGEVCAFARAEVEAIRHIDAFFTFISGMR